MPLFAFPFFVQLQVAFPYYLSWHFVSLISVFYLTAMRKHIFKQSWKGTLILKDTFLAAFLCWSESAMANREASWAWPSTRRVSSGRLRGDCLFAKSTARSRRAGVREDYLPNWSMVASIAVVGKHFSNAFSLIESSAFLAWQLRKAILRAWRSMEFCCALKLCQAVMFAQWPLTVEALL